MSMSAEESFLLGLVQQGSTLYQATQNVLWDKNIIRNVFEMTKYKFLVVASAEESRLRDVRSGIEVHCDAIVEEWNISKAPLTWY